MAEQSAASPVGSKAPLDRVETPIVAVCGKCLLPLHPAESGVRHFGLFNAHSEHRCIELLRAQLAEAKRDAERYQLARLHSRMTCNGSTHVSFALRVPGPQNEHGFVDPGLHASSPECFDAAIDAALAKAQGEA